ncbi:MAG: hypothetical protein OXE92_02035 [Bacteroidetes bacterium]|nr:hypothetical protein [Bacteroidota bacterium]MCY4204487.1 hypothetical protein [Bacteroidota bacterium]
MTTTSNRKVASHDEAEKQIKQNDDVYLERKREFENLYHGKILLMHNGKIEGAFNDDEDAYLIGCDKFELGNFSLHRVGKKPVELGYISYGIRAEKIADATIPR